MDERSGRVQLYDTDTRTWERRARVPKRVGEIGPWTWTGNELVVFKEISGGRIVAYDPEMNAWRTLPESPLPGHDVAVSADGRIVVAHVDRQDEVDLSRELAVLDLADETWSELPPPVGLERLVGLIWTGSQLLAVTVAEDEDLVQVASLDLGTRAWSEPVTGPLGWYWAHPLWTGERLVFAGGESFGGHSDASLDPTAMTCVTEDFECPLSTAAAVWTGELIVSTDWHIALDPTTRECYRLPGRDRVWSGNAVVWTGDRIIYWSGGGAEEGDPDPFRHGGEAFVLDRASDAEGRGRLIGRNETLVG